MNIMKGIIFSQTARLGHWANIYNLIYKQKWKLIPLLFCLWFY